MNKRQEVINARRTNLGIISLAVALALPASASARGDLLASIREAFDSKYETVETIRCQYEVSPTELLTTSKKAIKLFAAGLAISDGSATEEWVLHRSGKVSRHVKRREKTGTEFESLDVYDGNKFVHNTSEDSVHTAGQLRKVYSLVNVGRLTDPKFTQCLLDYSLFAFPLHGLPPEAKYRDKYYASSILEDPRLVLREEDSEDGRERRIVLVRDGEFEIWLSPALDFSATEYHVYRGGVKVAETSFDDFVLVAEGVWLPRKAQRSIFGGREFDGQFVGQAIYRNDYKVLALEVNQPEHAAAFTVRPEAGSWIVDETLVPQVAQANTTPNGQRIIPSVSYIQPASDADVEKTIERAKHGVRGELLEDKPAATIGLAIWANVVLVIGLLSWLAWRKIAA